MSGRQGFDGGVGFDPMSTSGGHPNAMGFGNTDGFGGRSVEGKKDS